MFKMFKEYLMGKTVGPYTVTCLAEAKSDIKVTLTEGSKSFIVRLRYDTIFNICGITDTLLGASGAYEKEELGQFGFSSGDEDASD